MADAWDDDDGSDAWDMDSDDDEALEAKLGLNTFIEKVKDDIQNKAILKTKGKALATKRAELEERKLNEELTRKAIELELEHESKLTNEEKRELEKQREEKDAIAGANDLFGNIDDVNKTSGGGVGGGSEMGAGDTVKMIDLKDHLKHARKVGQCIKKHQKTHLAQAFLKEAIMECKDVLDDDAITELIKTMNVIKNEKVAAAKRKVKGQAQKSKKQDKQAEAKAKKIQQELYGDHDQYIDQYDDYGEQYEDDFF